MAASAKSTVEGNTAEKVKLPQELKPAHEVAKINAEDYIGQNQNI